MDGLTGLKIRVWVPLLLGLIMLFDSWDSIAIAYVMPSLIAEWHIDLVHIGFMISAGYGGQFVGALFFGTLAERYGRMPVFQTAIVAMCLLAICCSLSSDYYLLLGLRFLQGMAIGGALPVCITYINELAPTATRGRYFSIFQFITMSGYTAASVSSMFIVPNFGWRWMFALGAIPMLLLPLVRLTLPESPRWLVRRGRIDDANKALIKLGGKVMESEAPLSLTPQAPAKHSSLAVLFGPLYRNRTAVVIPLWFLTALVNFGLVTWVPTIYVKVFHIEVATALRYSATAGSLFLIAAPIVALLIDGVGRRPLAIGGSLICGTALLTLTVIDTSDTFRMVLLVGTGQLASCVSAMIVWPYTAEVYPTQVRAMGLSLGSSIARAASMLTPAAVGGLLAVTGSVQPVFALLGLSAVGVATIWWKLTRETARKSLEQIEAR